MPYNSITIFADGTSSTDQYPDQAAAVSAYGNTLSDPAIVLFWIYDTVNGVWFIGGPQ